MRAARFLSFPVIERSGRGTLTRYRQAAKALQRMIKTYKIEAIAIGNGTASRESKEFVERSLTPLPPSPAERGSAGDNSMKSGNDSKTSSLTPLTPSPAERGSAGDNSMKSGNDSKTSSYESENEAPSLKEGAGGEAVSS